MGQEHSTEYNKCRIEVQGENIAIYRSSLEPPLCIVRGSYNVKPLTLYDIVVRGSEAVTINPSPLVKGVIRSVSHFGNRSGTRMTLESGIELYSPLTHCLEIGSIYTFHESWGAKDLFVDRITDSEGNVVRPIHNTDHNSMPV